MPGTSRSPFNRPRWTEEDARAALAALERSGQPVREFAEAHGLDPQRLYAWRRRLARGEPTTFREVIVRPSTAQTAGQSFEIVLASGLVVRVPASFDEDTLTHLLHVLTQARAC